MPKIADQYIHLIDASKRYARGEIDNQDYRNLEDELMIDYNQATSSIVKYPVKRLANAIRGFIWRDYGD